MKWFQKVCLCAMNEHVAYKFSVFLTQTTPVGKHHSPSNQAVKHRHPAPPKLPQKKRWFDLNLQIPYTLSFKHDLARMTKRFTHRFNRKSFCFIHTPKNFIRHIQPSPKQYLSSISNIRPISSISQSFRCLLGWIFQEQYTLSLI